MGRFEVDVAEELGNSTYPPACGDGSPPLVRFAVSEDRLAMTATPPGVLIRCALQDDGASRVYVQLDGNRGFDAFLGHEVMLLPREQP